jgi:hypothetical protein
MMSGKITGQVWDLDLPHAEAWVLMSMADHAEHDGSNVFPSQPLIAWKTGYSVRQVRRIQDRLKARKILIPEGFGPHGTTLFRIDLSRAPLKPEFSRADKMSSEDTMSSNRRRPVFTASRVRQDKMSAADKMSSEDISDIRPDIQMSDKPSLETSRKEIHPPNANALGPPSSAHTDEVISVDTPAAKFVNWWNHDIVPLGGRPFALDDADDKFVAKANKAIKAKSAKGYWNRVTDGFKGSRFLRGECIPTPGKKRFKATLPWLLSQHHTKSTANYVLVVSGEWSDDTDTGSRPYVEWGEA